MNEIHNIKEDHLSVFWYQIIVTNMSHLTKGEYIGHVENIDEEENSHLHKNSDAHTMNSVTTQKMMSEQVEPDTFEPPCHKLKPNIKTKYEALLKEYKSQFA